MKQFKILDFWVSVLLIFGFTLYGLALQSINFIIGYLVVGGWQIISLLIHYYNNWFCEKGGRRRKYQLIVIIVLLAGLLGFVIPPILFMLAFALLFVAPIMAVYYSWICYNEIYFKMQRPLALLK